jgi:hypothetical protein
MMPWAWIKAHVVCLFGEAAMSSWPVALNICTLPDGPAARVMLVLDNNLT